MNETQVCQSCGMPVRIVARSVSGGPMAKPEDFGTNADGSPSSEYCCYCFQGGEFTAKMEMPEFIEMQISPQHQSHLTFLNNQ